MDNRLHLQRNAADPRQVRYAERKSREVEARFFDALKDVLGTASGRFVCWVLLERAGIYRSIWDPSAKIHYNAGRQDFGHELLAALLAADEEGYQRMEREMRQYLKSQQREATANQTPSAEEKDTNG